MGCDFRTKRILGVTSLAWLFALPAVAAPITTFTPDDLIISTVSCSVGAACSTASGGLDTASAITLQEFGLGAGGTSATSAGTLALPQTSNGANSAMSGEYGSASEGILQRSGNGQYLTIVGYGVNASDFNTAPVSTYGTAALGQTTSLVPAQQTGSPVTTVPRVVGLIGADGSIDTSTTLTGVFNTNNPQRGHGRRLVNLCFRPRREQNGYHARGFSCAARSDDRDTHRHHYRYARCFNLQ